MTGDVSAPGEETKEELILDLNGKMENEIIELDDGQQKLVQTFDSIHAKQKEGPFTIQLQSIQLSQFEPNEDQITEYDGSDLALISIELEVENESENTNNIYPMQGTILTDTGEKVDVHFSMSDQVGGEFQGQMKKKGQVHCFFLGDVEDISKITYKIEAGHDQKAQSLGDDFQFVFTLN